MLHIVLKKLLKNKWMTICMLTGSILITALLSGIPIYAQGVLQRVLTKDLEKIQAENAVYPDRAFHPARAVRRADFPERAGGGVRVQYGEGSRGRDVETG